MPLLAPNWNPPPSQLRHFAWLLTLLFALAGWREEGSLAGLVCSLTAALIFAVGTVWPQVLRGPYVLLVVVTYPLGWALGQLFLALVFFGLITPLALSFRLLRRDSLQRRFQTEATTYWQPRPRGNDLRSYVRQF
jgi:hypothetical protein